MNAVRASANMPPLPADEADLAQNHILNPLVRYVFAVVYGAIMVVLYQSLSVYWAYLGFDYRPLGMATFAVVTLGATPALLLPQHPSSLGQFACWLLNFILFMPALIIPQLQGWAEGWGATALFVTLILSIYGFIWIARFDSTPLPLFHFPPQLFWVGIIGLWAIFHGTIFVMLGDNLQLAGLGQEVYDQRQATTVQIGGGLLIYVITNASGAINPVLVAVGVFERKWWAVALGLVGQLIVYATLAGKIALIFPLVVIGTYFLFSKGRLYPMRLALVMVGIAVFGIPLQLGREQLGDVAGNIVDLIYMRTLYLPGVLVGAYHDFFSIYPLTYFSHSLIGRPFSEYPYGIWSVGQVVGNYITPGVGYGFNNYNANFIAADGIAGFGLAGIPLLMLTAVLLLRLIDKVLGGLDLKVRCAALAPFLMWITDGSLTTAMLTGGGIVACALLWIYSGSRIAIDGTSLNPVKGA